MGSLHSSDDENDDDDALNVDNQEAAPDDQYNFQGAGIILKIHQINNYTPLTSTRVNATLYRGADIVRTVQDYPCRFQTMARDYSRVKEDPSGISSPVDKNVGKYLRLGEQVFWE